MLCSAILFLSILQNIKFLGVIFGGWSSGVKRFIISVIKNKKWIFFLFRHHTYKKVDGQVELSEVGPRFEMKGML